MDTPNIYGYQIKNHICKTQTFQLFDAIDPTGHSCVLKEFNDQSLSPQQLSNSNWFNWNDHIYVIYKDQDYNMEGNDYFNYDNGEAQYTTTTTTTDKNNLIFITPKKSSSFIKQYPKHNSIEILNNNNNNNKFLSSSHRRIRTPMPHNINALPDSPYSNYSIESSDTNNNDNTTNYDSDDSNDSDESDLDNNTINNNCIISHGNCNLKPILNNNKNSINDNDISPIKQENEKPCHIHIQTPTLLIDHHLHHHHNSNNDKHIRRTPIPKGCWFERDDSSELSETPFFKNNNDDNNNNKTNNTNAQQQQEPSKLFQSWNNDDRIPNDNTFELKIIQSSMLKRRSLPKCQFTT